MVQLSQMIFVRLGVTAVKNMKSKQISIPSCFQRSAECFRDLHLGRHCHAVYNSYLAEVRKNTGCSLSLCKRALELHNNDSKKAIEWISKEAAANSWEKYEFVPNKDVKTLDILKHIKSLKIPKKAKPTHKTAEEQMDMLLQPLKTYYKCKSPVVLHKRYPDLFPEHFPQFLAKIPEFANIYKIRSKLKHEILRYLNEEGFTNVDVPVMTRYLKDATESTLYIECSKPADLNVSHLIDDFGHPVYLSTSGQLHLQCFTSGLHKVFSLGPSFNSELVSGKHLVEFWRVTCEEAFLDGSEGFNLLLRRAESFVKFLMKTLSEQCSKELELFPNKLKERLKDISDMEEFPRITYREAVEIMVPRQHEINNRVQYGMHIQRTAEKVLTEHVGGKPFFITDYPLDMEPFNAAYGVEENTVKTFSLVLPSSTVVVNGGLREHNYEKLSKKLEEFEGTEYFSWWMDSQKWGTAPSGGFSLGIDRLMHFILKDRLMIGYNTPFPRAVKHCKL